jgi:uncharacterized protein YndB with AHSA1/START domain
MATIYHDFNIRAEQSAVFELLSTAAGLDHWWTQHCSGKSQLGSTFELSFGEGYVWTALVTKLIPDQEFELTMIKADSDWEGTRIGFQIEQGPGSVIIRFSHQGWPAENQHYRLSSYCWAMYLRLAKRFLEKGERFPFENRLSA